MTDSALAEARSESEQPAPPAAAREGTWVGLVSGLFLAPTALGFSAAPVALPSLATGLRVSAGCTAWVLAAYSLTTAVLTALSGRLADRHGLLVLLWVATPALLGGTLLLLVAPDLAAVVAARLLQGIGAGAAGVIAFRLPTLRLPDATSRGRALGTLGVVVGLGSGAGALFGGLLTDSASWRWALALPGLAVLVVPLVLRLTPRHTGTNGPRLDVVGAVITLLGVAAVTVVIQAKSTRLPWWVEAIAGAVAGCAFIAAGRRTRRMPDGFLPKALLGNTRFVLAASVGFLLFASYLVLQFSAPRLLLAHHHHLSATAVGAILLPAGLVSAALSWCVGRLVTRTGPWPLVVCLATGSFVGMLLAGLRGTSPVAVVLALAACVSGFSAGQVTLMAALPDLVEPGLQGIAVGSFQLVFITGGSVGAAAIGGLVGVMSLNDGVLLLATMPAAAVLLCLTARRKRAQRPDDRF